MGKNWAKKRRSRGTSRGVMYKGAEAAFAAEALQRRKGTLELFVCSSVCFLNTNLTMSQTPQFSENRDKHPFFFFFF